MLHTVSARQPLTAAEAAEVTPDDMQVDLEPVVEERRRNATPQGTPVGVMTAGRQRVPSSPASQPRSGGGGVHRDGAPFSAGTPGVMTNYAGTFRIMSARRLERELQGTHTKPASGQILAWVLAFAALEVGLASITLSEGISLKIDLTVNLLSNLLGLLVLTVLLYCAINSVAVIRWCIFSGSPPARSWPSSSHPQSRSTF